MFVQNDKMAKSHRYFHVCVFVFCRSKEVVIDYQTFVVQSRQFEIEAKPQME